MESTKSLGEAIRADLNTVKKGTHISEYKELFSAKQLLENSLTWGNDAQKNLD